MDKKQEYKIPVEGSLGLLALGYRGLMLWREKRAEYEKEHGKYRSFFIRKKTSKNRNDLDEYLKQTR